MSQAMKGWKMLRFRTEARRSIVRWKCQGFSVGWGVVSDMVTMSLASCGRVGMGRVVLGGVVGGGPCFFEAHLQLHSKSRSPTSIDERRTKHKALDPMGPFNQQQADSMRELSLGLPFKASAIAFVEAFEH